MSDTQPFNGFPDEGLQFLRDIEVNNNKAWFEDNRTTFDAYLMAPAQDFVAALGSRLRTLDPAIVVDTRTNGRGVLMRFYRDTRFSKDKSPYKTNIAGMFTDGQGKKTERPAFGFHMGADNMELMAGMFKFSTSQLAAYRDAVAGEDSGEELAATLRTLGGAGEYHLAGEHYKRVPAGYEADHPHADLLRYAGLYVYPAALEGKYLSSPELVEASMAHFKTMAPVYEWLAKYVGNSQ
jgi:uncharacterized protein (TIGR02453 family)